jgi:hypothetical protein
MKGRLRAAIGPVLLATGLVLGMARTVYGAALDENGEITLGVRAYTAARVGSQDTDISIIDGTALHNRQTFRSLTFPVSAAGHLRQNRFFVEAELKQRLDRLIQQGFGPLALLNDLPFTLRNVSYDLVYRGEYEGVYDYGPAEYSTAFQYTNETLIPPFNNKTINVLQTRRSLRNTAVERQRLFQAFVEADAGPLFLRFGRQILAWGETDVFRLLDNINPIDNSFGGFLVPLDERRVPLDMLRSSYHIPEIPKLPFYEMFLEGFAAIDNAVSIDPGIPNGSPWQLPNLLPNATLLTTKDIPPTTVAHTRGGVQLKFSAPIPVIEEASFGIAHYYTYLDVPTLQTFVSPSFPVAINNPDNPDDRRNGFLAVAKQAVPTTQITGASSTFLIPADIVRHIGLSGEPVIRSELAYFRNEARFTQATLDPFVYGIGGCSSGAVTSGGLCTGNVACKTFDPVTHKCTQLVATGPRTGDSWNFVLGIDLNQFIRPLNPNQSFFISTQFFYKHLNGAQKREPIPNIGPRIPGQPQLFNGEVLPVPAYNQSPDSRGIGRNGAVESVFVHNPIDQYLQTLLIATSYYSGQVVPAIGVFYDWSGSFVAQPQITFSRDPFRFTTSYSYLAANSLKGASGISLLHDRDNFLFQFEYVL